MTPDQTDRIYRTVIIILAALLAIIFLTWLFDINLLPQTTSKP